jgi:hypothetical protein
MVRFAFEFVGTMTLPDVKPFVPLPVVTRAPVPGLVEESNLSGLHCFV